MPVIQYTDTATTRTVKPTQTRFTNSTGDAVTLTFANGSLLIATGDTSDKISKTIVSILRGGTYYYSAHGNDYTIPPSKVVPLAMNGRNIDMTIP